MTRVNVDAIEFADDYTYNLNGTLFTGIGYEADESGVLMSEMEFKNGIQHGVTRLYFSNGLLKKESYYEYNTLSGITREWDTEGKLEREEEYERGICIRRSAVDSRGKMSQYYELTPHDEGYEILQLMRKAKFV